MSSSNLRDHCASALTVLFSGSGVEPEAAKVSGCREDEQLRAELPGQQGQTLGSSWMPPSPRPHSGDAHQGRTPVSSPLFLWSRGSIFISAGVFSCWFGFTGAVWELERGQQVQSPLGTACSRLCLGKVGGRGQSQQWWLSPCSLAVGSPKPPF